MYAALGNLREKAVFVGGATVSLYATHPAAAEEVRPTKDVDLIVPVSVGEDNKAHQEYADIEAYLRQKGFSNDRESGIMCRYLFSGLVVDVMPVNSNLLGFRNRWYAEGFANAVVYPLSGDVVIRIFTAPYFLASKWEAFAGRGQNDGRTSADFEDLVYVLNNRTSVWEECHEAPARVREYLREKFSALLLNPDGEEWISGHLERDFAAQQTAKILAQMRAFVAF